jgi:hypothetical protein
MRPKTPEPLTLDQMLVRLHDILAPVENYLEVRGSVVLNGRDRAPTADEYFSCESCERPTLDLALIDDHSRLFEDALRDFVYVQRYAGPHTVVVFSGIFPRSQDLAWRHPVPEDYPGGAWAGDVFKIPFILGTFQPRLHLIPVDVAPAGALIVTGLDRSDVTLDRQFDRIVKEYHHGHYEGPVNPITGDNQRHWNHAPDSILGRHNAVSTHAALAVVTEMVERGELAKGKPQVGR